MARGIKCSFTNRLPTLSCITSAASCTTLRAGACAIGLQWGLPSESDCRTHAGSAIDLAVEKPEGGIPAMEIKRKLTPELIESMEILSAKRGVMIIL